MLQQVESKIQELKKLRAEQYYKKKDEDLSEQMVGYLVNFCKSGNPNGDGLTQWNAGGEQVLRLGEKDTHMGKVSMLKLVYTMLTNKAVGE